MAKQTIKYTETRGKNLKIVGIIDAENNSIVVDGEVIDISTMLCEFDKMEVSFSMSMKDEEELDVPENIVVGENIE